MDGLIGREGGRGSVEALLRLALTPGLGPRTIRASLEGARTVDAVLARVERTHRLATSAEAEGILAACRRDRVTTTGLDGTDYPEPLRHLPDPPPVVFHRGELGVLTAPRVVIVGSRQATAYGRRVAGVLAAMSARAGWTVVSGMALGIDGAAHRGALDAGGATAAVLGSGPDRPSPTAHRRLATAIAQEGVLLSELPPGTPARPHHFPRRNRLLAALADRVVVVEAAKRSGALITARLALELGREVWAVPGPVFSPVCEGTHLLLEDGGFRAVRP
ncbi:MAG: DNA-processing protein DprA [Gemmatimonadota bacterium]